MEINAQEIATPNFSLELVIRHINDTHNNIIDIKLSPFPPVFLLTPCGKENKIMSCTFSRIGDNFHKRYRVCVC